MSKSIKKSFKYLIVFASIIIMLLASLFVLLSNARVQTFIVQKITNSISKNLKSAITIAHVKFSLFNKLAITDLLILDLNKDTLFYSSETVIGLRKIDIKNNIFRIGKIEVNDPVIKFMTDSTGVMNLTAFTAMLKNPSDTIQTKKSILSISQIEIKNGRFFLKDARGMESKTKIDFNNIKLSDVNTLIDNVNFEGDSISLDIYRMIFSEASGFKVKSLSSQVNVSNKKIFLTSFNLNLDSSVVNASHLGLIPVTPGIFSDFINNVKLDVSLDRSLIKTSDFNYFIPALDSINESFFFSGDLTGTIAELRGRDITLNYNDHTTLLCDFDFSGLPDIQNTYIYIGVTSFITNTSDIGKIKLKGKGNIAIPETLRNLGDIFFKGNFTGFLTDFVTYGNIRTKKGNISTDISLKPEKNNSFSYKGLINGSLIDLGEITGKPELFGDISFKTDINGSATSFTNFAASVTGSIDSIVINNYKYRNITLNGSFSEYIWDGSIKIDENNIKLDLLGRFDFSKELPVFDFTMNLEKSDLQKLNISSTDTSSSLSLQVTANFTGNNLDNIYGDIKILNSRYRKFSNNLDIKNLTISAFSINNQPAIDITSEMVDANIRGHYNFAGIAESVKITLAALMPIEFTRPEVSSYQSSNNFTFNVNFKKTDELNAIFRTGLKLAENSTIRGAFFPDSAIYLTGKSTSLSTNNIVLNNLSINANIKDSILVADLNSSSLLLAGKTELKDFNINLTTTPDNFKFISGWDNKDKVINKGSIKANGVFSKNNVGKSFLKINVLPTQIEIKDKVWDMNPASIIIDSTTIAIQKLNINNKGNFFLIDGSLSENLSDSLKINFNGIDLASLNSINLSSTSSGTENIPLLLKGQLNGTVSLTNVYKNFMFESDLNINGFSILGSNYGNIIINSKWDNNQKIMRLIANNNLEGVKMFDISGFYDPSNKNIDITALAEGLPVDFLNPLLKTFASEIKGNVTGKIKLEGKIDQPVLIGAVMARDASIKIDYLQSSYSFSDSVRFDRKGIKFNNITAYDIKGNPIKVNGFINHTYFKTYTFDMTLTPNNSMVLNTKVKDNELFYGTAYGSGVITIKGADGNIAFDISATTGKNTKFYVPITSGLSISSYSFISFVDSASLKKAANDSKTLNPILPSKETIELNIDLNVTPDAEVQLIFDSKIGDIMKGRGQSNGSLNLNMAKNGDFKIYGDYVIEQGEYLFTLGNILNKKFTVQNGGTITFNGDISNAELNINAIYSLRASLFEILQDELYKNKTVDVQCHLNLTGNLFNPIIGMQIELPNADDQTRSYLKNAINTEEELSKQFVYLLVMNSFYSDQNLASSSNAATGTSAMAVTTTEMLSNQLSNWLSQISNQFDIGFNYRPGNELSAQEMELAFSTQVLNDRVILNGNFDVGGTQTVSSSNPNNITGAFNVEVKLTEKIRFKVFNRPNDNILYDANSYSQQGFGLFFRQEFNKFKDLFKKNLKGDMKKEEIKTQEVSE